tara:strand:- start:977 stop:2494 length:1518 start_codon:yes stop_codon:yes gene_type:complete
MSQLKKDEKKKGVFLSYLLIGLNGIVGVVYTPILLQTLGYSDYALYSLSSNIIGFLVFLDFGLNNGIVRYITKYLSSNNEKKLPSFYGMFLTVFISISLLILMFGILIHQNIDALYSITMNIDEITKFKKILVIMFSTMAICFPFNLFLAIITAKEHFIFLRTVIICRIIINTFLLIIFLKMGYGIVFLVSITSLFNFIVVFANYLFCKFKLKIKIQFNNFDKKKLIEVVRFSFLLFTVVIFEKIIWSGSQIILGMYVSTLILSVFSIAFLLQQIYASFSTAFSGVFLPKITNMVVNNRPDSEISDLFIRSGRIQFFLISIIFSGFIIFGKTFILFWAGPEFQNAYYTALFFFIPLSILSVQSLGKVILTSRNQLKTISIVYFITVITSIILQFILVKDYGVNGITLGVVLPLMLGPIIYMNLYYHAKQSLDVLNFWSEIIKSGRLPLIFALSSYFFIYFNDINSIIYLIIYIVIYAVLYLIIIWNFSLNKYEKELFLNFLKKIV